MTRIEIIEAEIEKLNAKVSEVWNRMEDYPTYSLFEKALEPYTSQIDAYDRELRMLMPVEYDDLPDYGTVMSLKEFIENVKSGGFIDYDGYGSYVKDGKESNITIYPSDIAYGVIREGFDTIIWYNR